MRTPLSIVRSIAESILFIHAHNVMFDTNRLIDQICAEDRTRSRVHTI